MPKPSKAERSKARTLSHYTLAVRGRLSAAQSTKMSEHEATEAFKFMFGSIKEYCKAKTTQVKARIEEEAKTYDTNAFIRRSDMTKDQWRDAMILWSQPITRKHRCRGYSKTTNLNRMHQHWQLTRANKELINLCREYGVPEHRIKEIQEETKPVHIPSKEATEIFDNANLLLKSLNV